MIDESQIRTRAYELWERDGSPEGGADGYWHLASSQLDQESNGLEAGEDSQNAVAGMAPVAVPAQQVAENEDTRQQEPSDDLIGDA